MTNQGSSGSGVGSGAIRTLIAMYASAFTSQGLGVWLRTGIDGIAIICLVCGLILGLIAAFWPLLVGRLIGKTLAASAIDLANEATWWAASIMLLFLYVTFSPLFGNLANLGEIGIHFIPNITNKTNQIAWNFEDRQHPPYFFGFQKTNLMPQAAFIGFQAHGQNTSDKPIVNIKGLVRSGITNRELPIYFVVQGIPVTPAETEGIPPFAEFDVVSWGEPVHIDNGILVSKAENISEFTEFTFEFDYDGNKFVRAFSKQETQHQKEMFENSSDPEKSSIPHVVRKSK